MVRLHLVVIQEPAEEAAHRQAEATREVRGENHALAGLWFRRDLVAGDANDGRRWDLTGVAEAEEVILSDLRPLPATVRGGHRDVGVDGGGDDGEVAEDGSGTSVVAETARRRWLRAAEAATLALGAEGKGRREARKKMEREEEPRPPLSAICKLSGREWDLLCIPVDGLWLPIARVSGRHRAHTRQRWSSGSRSEAEACAR